MAGLGVMEGIGGHGGSWWSPVKDFRNPCARLRAMCGADVWSGCVERGCVETRAVEDFATRGRMCVSFCFLNLSMQTQLSW